MESKVNYTVVGIFVVVLGFAVIAGGLWLTRGRQTANYNTYITIMHESVSGLSVQAPVKFNGVTVGYVKSIALNYKNPQQVILFLNIEAGTPVTTSTVATLLAQGITGITYVGLKATSAKAPQLKAAPGDKFPIIKSTPSLLVQLDRALRDITKNMSDISNSFKRVFDEQNTLAIKNSLQSIQSFTKTLADNSQNINESIQSAKVLLKNGAEASKQFPSVMKKLQATLDDAQAMTERITEASQQVEQTMQNGNSAIQTLNQQALPSAVTLINKLDNVAGNLQKLSAELQRNPSIIVRGKLPAAPGPGE